MRDRLFREVTPTEKLLWFAGAALFVVTMSLYNWL